MTRDAVMIVLSFALSATSIVLTLWSMRMSHHTRQVCKWIAADRSTRGPLPSPPFGLKRKYNAPTRDRRIRKPKETTA